MAYLLYFYVVLFMTSLCSTEDSRRRTSSEAILLSTTEAFLIPITNSYFPAMNTSDSLRYLISVQDMPDIPSWMFYRFDDESQTGILYGSPVSDGDIELDVIALNSRTYETSQDSLKLTVVERERKAKYEAELKFTNFNIQDVYLENKTRDILQIFREKLWKDSSDVYITKIVAPTDVGGRLPVDPKDKEGIIVRVGSVDFFSRDLLDLEREVTQLKNRTPCPRKYKATSAEYLFHRNHNDFQNDWCSFQLIRV